MKRFWPTAIAKQKASSRHALLRNQDHMSRFPRPARRQNRDKRASGEIAAVRPAPASNPPEELHVRCRLLEPPSSPRGSRHPRPARNPLSESPLSHVPEPSQREEPLWLYGAAYSTKPWHRDPAAHPFGIRRPRGSLGRIIVLDAVMPRMGSTSSPFRQRGCLVTATATLPFGRPGFPYANARPRLGRGVARNSRKNSVDRRYGLARTMQSLQLYSRLHERPSPVETFERRWWPMDEHAKTEPWSSIFGLTRPLLPSAR